MTPGPQWVSPTMPSSSVWSGGCIRRRIRCGPPMSSRATAPKITTRTWCSSARVRCRIKSPEGPATASSLPGSGRTPGNSSAPSTWSCRVPLEARHSVSPCWKPWRRERASLPPTNRVQGSFSANAGATSRPTRSFSRGSATCARAVRRRHRARTSPQPPCSTSRGSFRSTPWPPATTLL